VVTALDRVSVENQSSRNCQLANHQSSSVLLRRGATGRLSKGKVSPVTLKPHIEGCHIAESEQRLGEHLMRGTGMSVYTYRSIHGLFEPELGDREAVLHSTPSKTTYILFSNPVARIRRHNYPVIYSKIAAKTRGIK
jgi:hypothetical protein